MKERDRARLSRTGGRDGATPGPDSATRSLDVEMAEIRHAIESMLGVPECGATVEMLEKCYQAMVDKRERLLDQADSQWGPARAGP